MKSKLLRSRRIKKIVKSGLK